MNLKRAFSSLIAACLLSQPLAAQTSEKDLPLAPPAPGMTLQPSGLSPYTSITPTADPQVFNLIVSVPGGGSKPFVIQLIYEKNDLTMIRSAHSEKINIKDEIWHIRDLVARAMGQINETMSNEQAKALVQDALEKGNRKLLTKFLFLASQEEQFGQFTKIKSMNKTRVPATDPVVKIKPKISKKKASPSTNDNAGVNQNEMPKPDPNAAEVWASGKIQQAQLMTVRKMVGGAELINRMAPFIWAGLSAINLIATVTPLFNPASEHPWIQTGQLMPEWILSVVGGWCMKTLINFTLSRKIVPTLKDWYYDSLNEIRKDNGSNPLPSWRASACDVGVRSIGQKIWRTF